MPAYMPSPHNGIILTVSEPHKKDTEIGIQAGASTNRVVLCFGIPLRVFSMGHQRATSCFGKSKYQSWKSPGSPRVV